MATPGTIFPSQLPGPLRADFVAPGLLDASVSVHEPTAAATNYVDTPLLTTRTTAEWIWSSDKDADDLVYLRYHVGFLSSPVSATMTYTGDNSADVYVDGSLVSSNAVWNQSTTVPFTLESGDVIAVACVDSGGSGGFIAQITWDDTVVVTNASWKAATTLQTDWETSGFDDSSWVQATAHGLYGVAPWYANVAGFPLFAESPLSLVYAPEATYSYGITVPLVTSTTLVYEPEALVSYPVTTPLVSATISVFEPTLVATYQIVAPAVTSTTFVYEPSATATFAVFPTTISDTTIHEPTLTATITAAIPAIPSANVVYQPETIKTPYPITPPAIASTTLVSEPSLSTSADVVVGLLNIPVFPLQPSVLRSSVSVEPPLVDATTVFYDPTLSTTVDAPIPLLTVAATVYEPVSASIYTVTTEHIPSSNVVYGPTLHHSISVPHIASTVGVFAPAAHHTLFADFMSATTAVYQPAMANIVSVGHISAATSVWAPAVNQRISFASIDARASLHTPMLATTVDVPIDFLYSPATLYPPGFTNVAYIQLDILQVSASVFAPEVLPQPVTVSPELISAEGDVHAPILSTFAYIIPPILSGAVLHAPSVQFAVQPSHVAATTTVFQPTSTNSATILPETISQTEVYASGVEKTGQVAPPTLDASATIHALTVAAGQVSATPPHIAATTTVPTPSVSASATILPTLIDETTVYEPSTQIYVHAQLLSVGHTVHAPMLHSAAYVAAEHIASQIALYEPTLAATASMQAPSLPTTTIVLEPSALPQAAYVVAPHISGTLTHEPILAATYLVEPSTIYTPGVYEPSVNALSTISFEILDVSAGVYPPAAHHTLLIPILDVAVTPHDVNVYASITRDIGYIPSTLTVFEPTVDFYATITPDTIDVGQVFAPSLSWTILPGLAGTGATVHEPTLSLYIAVPLISVGEVYEPLLSIAVDVPHVPTQTLVYTPNVDISYLIDVPATIAGTLVYEPTLNASYQVIVEHVDNEIAIYEPTASTTATILPGHISSSTFVYQPAPESVYTITVPLVSQSTIVYEPSIDTVRFEIHAPHIPTTLSVYDPTLSVSNSVTPDTISIGFVYEPALQTSAVISLEAIASTLEVFAPTKISQTLYIPAIGSITSVYTPERIIVFVVVPEIVNTPTVYAPTAGYTYPISVETLANIATVYEPTQISRITIEIPTIASTTNVWAPATSAGASIRPATIDATAIHQPTITVGPVSIQVPHLSTPPTVHEPAGTSGVDPPFLVGNTLIYGPSVTLRAPLEIIEFMLGINQQPTFATGVAMDVGKSVLVRNG